MTRRSFQAILASLALAALPARAEALRGRIVAGVDGEARLRTADGRSILLEGDDATLNVLADPRVAEGDFEAEGEFGAAGRFRIDPIHKRALYLWRDGRRLVITYWCEVCAIRTYSPGKCACCQEETALDPRDPALENAPSSR